MYAGNGTTNGTISSPTGNLTRRYFLTKRNTREYEVDLGSAGTLVVKSLGYPSPQKLFEDSKGKSLIKHAYTYKSVNIDDYTVTDAYTKPQGTHTWVVEHIIEVRFQLPP
jgi:hypothetical protein